MEDTHPPSHGHPHISGVLLPTTCEVCGASGTAFQASTAPGPAATFTDLPSLRCPDCHCLYQYNRPAGQWDGILGNTAPGLLFVPLADLPGYMAQWP
ncbi:MAG TPA: hypothetical protein VI542_24890 [Candidatus Tectomicrobia bacterium]